MKAAYAPLTFSWRGAQSGGWLVGVVIAKPRKPLVVEWKISEKIQDAAQGGFDLQSTLEAFEDRIMEIDNKTGPPLDRLKTLCSAWSFGTVQIGDPEQIEGEEAEILNLSLQSVGV